LIQFQDKIILTVGAHVHHTQFWLLNS